MKFIYQADKTLKEPDINDTNWEGWADNTASKYHLDFSNEDDIDEFTKAI